MSTDEMRMAAAKSIGWTQVFIDNSGIDPAGLYRKPIPDYDTSLDAVAELTKTLSSVEFLEGPFYLSEQAKFNSELERIVQRDLAGTKQERFLFDIINASAIQRLESYLIVKGLWIVKE